MTAFEIDTFESTIIGTTQTAIITFSEVVTGLMASDFSASGATILFSADVVGPTRGSEYGVFFRPTSATFTLTLAADSVIDADGNTGPASEVRVTGTAVPADTTAPTVTEFVIVIPAAGVVIGAGQTATITFSEVVTGLTERRFNTSTGVTGISVSGSGDTYTITFTPTAATFRLTLARNSVVDTARNPNPGPATVQSVDGTAVVADTTAPPAAPSVTLNADTGDSDTDGSTSDRRVNIAGVLDGATWEYSTDGGRNWNDGTGTQFTVPEGHYARNRVRVRQTLNGSTSAFAGLRDVSFDVTPPRVTTFADPAAGVIGTQQRHNISFDLAVTNFAVEYFNTSTGVTVNRVSIGNSTFTIFFTPTAATFKLILAANSVMDSAGNSGPATDVSVDGTAVLSADANLSSLTISAGTLSPEFDAATLGYTINVANDVTSTTVTPTLADAAAAAGATITVDGDTVESAAASNPIALTVGANAIAIVVTAADTTEQTYTVTVRRAPAAPSLALAADTGSLPDDRITSNGRVNVTGLESGTAWIYTVNGGAVSPTFTIGTGTFFTLDEGDYAVDQVQVVQILGGAESVPAILAAVTVDETAPEITRTGAATVTLTVGDTYTEQGATAEDDVDTDVTVTTDSSAVLIGTAGTYTVTYDATDVAGNDADTVTRTVIVQPALAISARPALASDNAGNYAIDGDTLSLTFSVNLPLASAPSVTIAGQSATVTGTGNSYTATYVVASAQVTALDGALATYDIGAMTAAGNPANTLDPDAADSTIRIDVSAPEITLNGDDVVRLIVGDPYTERNATATDNVDGSVTPTTGGETVLIDAAGVYFVTYDAVDAAGNEATQVQRTVYVNEPASMDADLVSLTITDNNNAAVTLDPTFDADADTVDYIASVDNEVTSVTVTAGYKTGTGTQTVTVNMISVDDEEASDPITLAVGVAKAIAIVVTATDGTTTKTYTVTVTRAAPATLSTDADLSALTLSAGALDPVFAAATEGYAVSVGNDVASITVTPTVADDGASVTVAGTDVTSGTPSAAIPLAVSANNIGITVTAEDASTKTYTVTITRAANSAPVIDAGNETLSAAENSERITTFTATDADTITWTLGGTDAGLFFIDRSSGRLSFTNPLDYETPQDDDGDNIYEITLTATDNGTPPASSEPLLGTHKLSAVRTHNLSGLYQLLMGVIYEADRSITGDTTNEI